MISNGYGVLKEKTFRIAHMGDTQEWEIRGLLATIDRILGLMMTAKRWIAEATSADAKRTNSSTLRSKRRTALEIDRAMEAMRCTSPATRGRTTCRP